MFTELPDLMSFLHMKYIEKLNDVKDNVQAQYPKADVDVGQSVDGFIHFAREYLRTNQPINALYLEQGLGLRFQEGQSVCFVQQPAEAPQMRDEGVPITRARPIPGQSSYADTRVVPITGR